MLFLLQILVSLMRGDYVGQVVDQMVIYRCSERHPFPVWIVRITSIIFFLLIFRGAFSFVVWLLIKVHLQIDSSLVQTKGEQLNKKRQVHCGAVEIEHEFGQANH